MLCLLLPVAGLSIDFDTEQLYWINSVNSTINRCKLDGSGLEVIEGVKLTKATALAIMGEEASVAICADFRINNTVGSQHFWCY